MVRVRDEEEFLEPSVRSIWDDVDEVVLIDNASTDGTPSIIERLARERPDRVKPFEYPHSLARIGGETLELRSTPEGRRSPRLSATFYNWCVERCTGPFILKWDGDMIALDAMRSALTRWRNGQEAVLKIQGVNVHPDRKHLVTSASTDREALIAELGYPGLPRWVTKLEKDFREARLFPKQGASYGTRTGWTQTLRTPFVRGPFARCVQVLDEVAYLHLKFCKATPLAAYTPDLARIIAANVAVGRALESNWSAELRRWRLLDD